MLYEDFKIYKVMAAVLNKMLFVDLGVIRCFILAPCYNSAMMMEFVFSFLLSHFSVIFLAKGKISKSVSLFLSDIGPKQRWPITLLDFQVVVRNDCCHPGHNLNR